MYHSLVVSLLVCFYMVLRIKPITIAASTGNLGFIAAALVTPLLFFYVIYGVTCLVRFSAWNKMDEDSRQKSKKRTVTIVFVFCLVLLFMSAYGTARH